MATHSSILKQGVRRTEEPGGLQPVGSQESDTAEATWHFAALLVSAAEPRAAATRRRPPLCLGFPSCRGPAAHRAAFPELQQGSLALFYTEHQ